MEGERRERCNGIRGKSRIYEIENIKCQTLEKNRGNWREVWNADTKNLCSGNTSMKETYGDARFGPVCNAVKAGKKKILYRKTVGLTQRVRDTGRQRRINTPSAIAADFAKKNTPADASGRGVCVAPSGDA
jgi:hypothetical protein